MFISVSKSDRLQRMENYISTIKNLSATLGMDSSLIITKVHPSLNELSGLSKNISDGILEKLDSTVKSLQTEKQTRFDKVINFLYPVQFHQVRSGPQTPSIITLFS